MALRPKPIGSLSIHIGGILSIRIRVSSSARIQGGESCRGTLNGTKA